MKSAKVEGVDAKEVFSPCLTPKSGATGLDQGLADSFMMSYDVMIPQLLWHNDRPLGLNKVVDRDDLYCHHVKWLTKTFKKLNIQPEFKFKIPTCDTE